jgi:hypothetical protein
MTIEVVMMMKIMIVKNRLLQNLQAFLDLEIIAEETSSCHGRG